MSVRLWVCLSQKIIRFNSMNSSVNSSMISSINTVPSKLIEKFIFTMYTSTEVPGRPNGNYLIEGIHQLINIT